MADQSRSKIIEKHPIGKGFDAFRSLFSLTCEGRGIISRERDTLDQLDQDGGYYKPASLQCGPLTSMQMYRILRLVFYQHFKFSLPPAF
ncbi:hypothetical protein EDB80DRAFT_304193 [Ilyonectria destructans]|nr:hypothetical protein EDB80DRAFT_304193 [Ilyonectria destructans]